MYKKWFALFMSLVLIFSIGSTIFAAEPEKSDLKVVLNGNTLSFAQSYVVDGRLVVPYRAIAEKIGATVSYSASDKKVTVKKGASTLVLNIDSKVATVNGKQVSLDVTALIINSSTYVPIRFLSENLGLTVQYNGTARTVALKSSTTAAEQKTYSVRIEQFAYSPETLTIPVGSKVTFTNYDNVEHTVTAKDGSFDSGLFGNGKSYTKTFTKAGEYKIYCKPHTFMVATIVVK
jgi:plastocyanin